MVRQQKVNYRGRVYENLLHAQWAYFFDLAKIGYLYREEFFIIDADENFQSTRLYRPPFLLLKPYGIWFNPLPALDRSVLYELCQYLHFAAHLTMLSEEEAIGRDIPAGCDACYVAFGAIADDALHNPHGGILMVSDLGNSVRRPNVSDVSFWTWGECGNCKKIILCYDFETSLGAWTAALRVDCCGASTEEIPPLRESAKLRRYRSLAQAFQGE